MFCFLAFLIEGVVILNKIEQNKFGFKAAHLNCIICTTLVRIFLYFILCFFLCFKLLLGEIKVHSCHLRIHILCKGYTDILDSPSCC